MQNDKDGKIEDLEGQHKVLVGTDVALGEPSCHRTKIALIGSFNMHMCDGRGKPTNSAYIKTMQNPKIKRFSLEIAFPKEVISEGLASLHSGSVILDQQVPPAEHAHEVALLKENIHPGKESLEVEEIEQDQHGCTILPLCDAPSASTAMVEDGPAGHMEVVLIDGVGPSLSKGG